MMVCFYYKTILFDPLKSFRIPRVTLKSCYYNFLLFSILRADVLANVATTIATLTSQLDTATAQIRNISEPDVFSCKRMSGYSDESAPVSYTACDVEKPSGLVGLDSGKFTVQRDGVYRLTFTAR